MDGIQGWDFLHHNMLLLVGSDCVLLTPLSSARLGMSRSNCSVNYFYVSDDENFFSYFTSLLRS